LGCKYIIFFTLCEKNQTFECNFLKLSSFEVEKLLKMEILAWYDVHKRDLPWRRTSDPYKVWISEVILQQTRIQQGLDYYLRFVEKFCTVNDLAEAPIDEVMKLWQGLGYYTRARNLHEGARQIVREYHGRFPEKYDQLIGIKGIGEYTASAIASICFNQPYPVLDGNVYRFVTRLFGIHEPVQSAKGKSNVKGKLLQLIDKDHPGDFNQAMMEMGALVCLPRKPSCQECPVNLYCVAYQQGLTRVLPVKANKKVPAGRFFHYLVFRLEKGNDCYLYLHKREHRDIWSSLYQFPLIEDRSLLTINELLVHPDFQDILQGAGYTMEAVSREYKHQLTHQTIHALFFEIGLKQELAAAGLKKFILIKSVDLETFPVSRLMEKHFFAKKV
jgi:A/G-specific adenine glycosylase